MDINYQLMDSIPASIYWKDSEGFYLGCNKYMLNMAGLTSREQIVGKNDFEMPWRKQAAKIRELDQLVIKNRKTYEREESPTLHNGIVQTFLSSKTPLFGENGNVIGVIGVSIDITEKNDIQQILKNTEHMLETPIKIKSRFLRSIKSNKKTLRYSLDKYKQ